MNRLKQRVTFVPFGNALNPEYLRDGLIFFAPNKSRWLEVLLKQVMAEDSGWNKPSNHRCWSKIKQRKAEISLFKDCRFWYFSVKYRSNH